MTPPKKPSPEREEENIEHRYYEVLEEEDVNDEEITKYKRFSIG